MQLKSLEIFVAVVECGSFSLAAEKLFTVQSNITNHIKKLETELACELLHRNPPIRATRAGQQLLHYARQMLTLHQQVRQQFRGDEINWDTPLQIGSMQTTAAVRLPEFFHALLDQYPKMSFHLHTAPTRDLINMINNAQLDCAFIANDQPLDLFYSLHLWTEQLVLLAPLNVENPLDRNYLLQQRFIGFRQGCSYRRSIELFLQHYQLPASQIVEMGSLDGITSCVSLGMGLAILPASYVAQSYYRTQVQQIVLDLPFAQSNTYLIAHRPETWSAHLKRFIEVLQQQVVQIKTPEISG